ncbi:MAG: hypothetical protein FWG61_00565, partial [Firmicutes bacterium]|nr:hypothetical protein [Bacillota bacterium]
ALGHEYEAVITAPTCTEDGFTTFTCIRCGDSYIGDIVPALGHEYEAVITAPTCTEDGFTTYTCIRCGDSYIDDIVPALGHDYVDTFSENGIVDIDGEHGVLYVCSRCHDSYIRKTVIKYDIVTIYSNADGINYKDPNSVYCLLDTGTVYDWHKVYFGSWQPPHPIFTGFPTNYSPEDFFTGSVISQYIWTKPYNETGPDDEAVFEFSYNLQKNALRRKVIATTYSPPDDPLRSPWLYMFNDCTVTVLLNDITILNPSTAWYVQWEGVTPALRSIIEDTSINTLDLKISAINNYTTEYGRTEKAMIIFGGAFAYEYEVFND